MKRFGDFLIDTGLISIEQLALALLEQLKSTPPSLVVLYENDCLDAQQVIDILALQSEERIDFPSACEKLNLWREEFVGVLQLETTRKRPKLGQIIVEKAWVDPQKLLAELHRFRIWCEENQISNKLKTPVVLASDTNKAQSDQLAPEPSAAPVSYNEFTPVFDHIEANSIPDFLDLFSEEKMNNMELTILSLESLAEADPEVAYKILDAFFGEYHSLKGAARSVGAALTEELIHKSEDLLTFFKQFSTKTDATDFALLTAINLSILDLLWHLRDDLQEFTSEESFWQEEATRFQYLSLLDEIQQTLQKLHDRGYELSLDDISDAF